MTWLSHVPGGLVVWRASGGLVVWRASGGLVVWRASGGLVVWRASGSLVVWRASGGLVILAIQTSVKLIYTDPYQTRSQVQVTKLMKKYFGDDFNVLSNDHFNAVS